LNLLRLGIIGYPLFFISALEILLGFILLKKNPRNSPVNKATAAFSFFSAGYSLFAGIVYFRASMELDYDFFYRLCWIGWFCIPAGLQFIYYMKDEKSRVAPLVGLILYPLWTIIYGLTLFTDLIERGAYSLIPFIDHRGPLENPVRLFGAILILWCMYEIYRAKRQIIGIKKIQVNYFLLGTLIFAGGATLMTGFFQLFGGFGVDPALSSYLSLPWVAFTFYAITRYRLFDIQIIISRTLTIVLLSIGVGAIQLGLFRLLEPFIGSTLAILFSLAIIGFILFRTPLTKSMQREINSIVLKGRYDYQETLRESTRAIVTILDLDELLNHIIDTIRRSLGVERVSLFLKREDGLYYMRCGWGIDKDIISNYQIEDGVISWVNQTKQVFVKEEQEMVLSEEDFHKIYKNMGEIGAELIIPLFYKGHLLGVLILGYKGNKEPYLQSDIDLLEALASQAAIAIENARLYEEAITDGLTGLYHHKYFKARLREEIERSKRYKHPLGLLMIDIDYFKNINDKYGHLVGDRILKELGGLLRKSIRFGDIIARYGGEEFALALPETDKKDALKVGERLRRKVEDMTFESNIKLTISVGVGCFDGEYMEFEDRDLINQADDALYRAKQRGRNRVEL
jgi:diguanylate cyclase (GGDEF)-like protein